MSSTIYVLYHRDLDGRFAGYCAWRYYEELYRDLFSELRPRMVFHEVQYNEPLPIDIDQLTQDDLVYVLDFSYDRQTLDRIHEKVKTLLVLDHHESAQEQLQGAVYAHFDMTRSGALMAWRHFFPRSPAPMPCYLANDFDLWQWLYSDTAAFEAWVQHDRVGSDWSKWDRLCFDSRYLKKCLEKGQLLVAHQESVMESFLNGSGNIGLGQFYYGETGDHARYAIHNGMGILHSQLGGKIVKHFNVDFSIGYRIKRDIVVFNVRSRDESKMNAKTFCKIYGGGGHPNASGFRLPLSNGLKLIAELHASTIDPD